MIPKTINVELWAEASVAPATAEQKGPPRFEAIAYSGQKMTPFTNPALQYPVVVDLAGMNVQRQRLPIFRDHKTDQVVGHSEKIERMDGQLFASGILSGAGPAATEVIASAQNGFVWGISIGATLSDITFIKNGASEKVNGRDVTGPAYVARASRLREMSMLAMPADDDAAVTSIAASAAEGHIMSFAQWLEAKGFGQETELNADQKTVLQAAFNAETGEKPGNNGGNGNRSPAAGDLNTILDAERNKEKVRKEIVDLTAKALQDHPGQLQIIEALSRQAMEGEWETQRYELELLRATRPQASQRIRSSHDEGLNGNMIEAALCIAGGLENIEKHYNEQTLEAASKRWRNGIAMGETFMLFARRNGYDGLSTRHPRPILKAAFAEPSNVVMMASPVSTLSLPGILANVANKFLKSGFDAVESTWRAVSAIRNVRDFKQISSYALTGDFKYVKVPPGGKLEHATVGEETYTNQAETYGRMFAIDRRDIINDDLGALTTVPRRLGRGAALKFNEVFWTEFLADHTSGGTFFPTNGSKGNYFAGATVGTNDSRMNVEGLTRAETLFFNQTDPDGQPLAVTPKVLLVPNAIVTPASELMRSAMLGNNAVDTTYPTGNPHAGKFTVVRSSYLGNSAMGGGWSVTAWYLLPDPNDLAFIETAFLNGVEAPTVESADADFDSLGIQMRGYHDFGVNKQEYRAAVKSKGAA